MNPMLTRRRFVANTSLIAGALSAPGLLRGNSADPAGSIAKGFTEIQPISYADVTITDPFWRSKLEKVATATLQACITQTEEKTGRIRNFEKAARRQGEKHEGIHYDDSDVYKALEAIAYSLNNRPNPSLEKKADEWIDKIAAAQLPDGYLNTYYTLKGLDQRWTDMDKHEDYCAGHLIEAAVAYYRTTGKRKLLDTSIRFADHLDATFRVPDRHWVSGHEEIELALMKLYHVTHERRYVRLAEWFLEQRGHGYGKGVLWGRGKDPGYCQDTIPVKDQREITGHAVRAMYLYTGAADVAAVTGDRGYMQAMRAVWEDVVHRNMYVTGGIGSSGHNEGFSRDYDLPNAEAYCETCASCGMVFWNQRMNSMTGESQYIDVLEKSLYNGALAGLSLSGDRFFYGNPLASTGAPRHDGPPGRREWFGTACCPSNIARLVASVGDYLYGVSPKGLWVNLFVASTAHFAVGSSKISLRIESDYPWNGNIKLNIDPERSTRFALNLRIPGWAKNIAAPGDLYRFAEGESGTVSLLLNGKPVSYREEKGYAVIDRAWRKGDIVELALPMSVRTVAARGEVEADQDRCAVQRGPLMYCVEGVDNGGQILNFVVPQSCTFTSAPYRVQSEDVVGIHMQAQSAIPADDGKSLTWQPRNMTAIPYYAWANRNDYQMQVWLPTRITGVKINT